MTENFSHQHYFYVFSGRPRRMLQEVDDPLCPDKVKLSGRYFASLYNQSHCTYVCEHENPIAANKAVIMSKEKEISIPEELFEGITVTSNFFVSTDFTCVTSGMLVPLDILSKIACKESDAKKVVEAAQELAVSVDGEVSKNSIMKQIIAKKIGDNFTVTNKIITKRTGNFSPYSRSRHDLCIYHNTHFFKNGVITTGLVSPSVILSEEVIEGEVTTSIMEFKTGGFVRDQALAEMMCTLTDCSIEALKEGKQINKALAYGLSINYATAKAVVYKMVMNFINKSFNIYVLKDEMTLHSALNMLISALNI